MKEIWKKKKIFVITIALMVGIIGTAATFAIITATAGTVTNTFQAAKVATEIEEEFEGKIKAGSTVKKIPSVKNQQPWQITMQTELTTPSLFTPDGRPLMEKYITTPATISV